MAMTNSASLAPSKSLILSGKHKIAPPKPSNQVLFALYYPLLFIFVLVVAEWFIWCYNVVMNPDSIICNMCPNRCNIDRSYLVGRCGVSYLPQISRVGLHMWEEPIISGEKGSGTIFFAGCNLQCVYCQNYRISHQPRGKTYTLDMLADAMRQLVDMGAHNINFVTPSHYTHILFEVLRKYKPPVPVVYNTSGYDSVFALRLLEGLVDIYLPDYKYIDSATAARYSHAPDYPNVAWQAIAEMHRQQPKAVIKDGIMQSGVMVRHLVLPGQSTASVQIVRRLFRTYGNDIYLSVMRQYTPYGEACRYPEINRTIKSLEYKRVVAALQAMGATQVFLQDADAASTAYIPPFDED